MLIPVAMGAIFAILFFPIQKFFKAKFKLGSYLSGILLTMGILILVILPFSYLLMVVADTGLKQIGTYSAAGGSAKQSVSFIEELLNAPAIHGVLEKISQFYPINFDGVIDTAKDLVAKLGLFIANALTAFLASLPSAVLSVIVLVVSLFFFLVDGKRFISFLKRNSFFTVQQTNEMLRYSGLMCRSVMLALVVSGLFQSLTFTLACLFVGLSNVVLILAAVFLTSFLPLVGSSPVTIGVALYQLIIGDTKIGVALLIVAIFVGLMDNLIRPMVIKGAGDLHPLITFISAFGGIQVFGITGVFLGPIVAGIFVVTLQILTKKPPRTKGAV